MKYYIIAGEASGDLHASNLIRALKEQDAQADFRAWGGDLMEAQGAKIIKHYRDLAFMGLFEVIANIRSILHNISFCKQDLIGWNPDVLILVDYPGFNLRMAKFAHQKGLKVIYYISPKIWAWKKSRVFSIKKYVDKMLIILPFEKDFYAKYDYPVEYVGNPIVDALPKESVDSILFRKENNLNDKPIIALLPGSRKQEIKKMLAVMLKIVNDYPDYQFVIAGASAIEDALYNSIMGYRKVALVKDKTHSLLLVSEAALVASGTATLEAALLRIPEVVCYKMNTFTFQIAKLFVKIPFISLVNLIMGKEVVRELIQKEFNAENLKIELNKILFTDKREEMIDDYLELKLKVGEAGASEKAASEIVHFLKLTV